ncbi:hypothetical protein QLX08_011068 [Tetragonisca angustula]|uniref:Uncharacterized protein n=1 Tax=Tetragonisca angustula TaxID=166442 RepID=A0AAW0Z9D3_9HYME
MFEISKFNMDKFIHTFMENLGLRIEACKKFNKITFVTSIDKSHIMKQLYSMEEMKEINVQQCLDFSTEKNIEYFIKKHAKLFDKFTYLNNAQILTSHLKNINTKLLQRVRVKRKHDGTIRKGEIKAWNKTIKLKTNLANKLNGPKCNSLSSSGCKQKYVNSYNCKRNKLKKGAIMGSLNLFYDNTASNDHKKDCIIGIDNDKQTSFLRRSLSNIMTSTTNKQLEMTEKFLWLHIKDMEYMKRNIEIILHVAKNTKYNYTKKNHTNYDQVLCYHAILCLIEPSKKGAVLMEDNLPVVIKKYLTHGYRYHFDFQRDSKDYYAAVLILSHWAKILVKHINTTMMHTISAILECDVGEILVLYSPKEK